jgi:hypothetical protein
MASSLATVGHESPGSSPFGVASSALSSRNLGAWLPAVAATGARWLRGLDTSDVNPALATVALSNMCVSGILQWSPAGQPLSFPTGALGEWTQYVSTVARSSKGRVQFWEVWNEPPNFTVDTSPLSYARIVVAAYDAMKQVDRSAQIGLSAQSNNVHWLEQAIEAGARDHFDYVTLHPYELLAALRYGGESLFLNIVTNVRRMLLSKAPGQANVPIWFTELGVPLGGEIAPDDQAALLLKAFVMSIAQGVSRIDWFEGRDGDSGPFGLMDATNARRPSYDALRHMISILGSSPTYMGWKRVANHSYGFFYRTAQGPVMVTWSQAGRIEVATFDTPVIATDGISLAETSGRSLTITPRPQFVSKLPSGLVEEAVTNRARPFSDGGSANALSVSLVAGTDQRGLYQFQQVYPRHVDGRPALFAGKSSAQLFAVDPTFASYSGPPLRVTVVVRRTGPGSAGFNLKFESSRGWVASGGWFSLPASTRWVSRSFDIPDPQFVGKWGYHFALDSDSLEHSQYLLQKVTVAKLLTRELP